jgi:hypothetical protein
VSLERIIVASTNRKNQIDPVMFRRLSEIVLVLTAASCRLTHAKESCTDFQETIKLSDFLTMSYVVNIEDKRMGQGTMHIEAVYEGVGWVGIGFSETGDMAPSVAVIGFPDDPASEWNPGKFRVTAQSESGISHIPTTNTTLTNTNIIQNETTTLLSFTIPLLQEGEPPIIANDGTSKVIWAYGYGNDLRYHADRGSAILEFTLCQQQDASTSEHVHADTTPTIADQAGEKTAASERVHADTTPTTIYKEGDTCLEFKDRLYLSPLVTMDYVVNLYDSRDTSSFPGGIMSAQITYKGLAWVAVGVSMGSGAMVPGEAIIGLPDESNGINNPGKYVLSSRDKAGVSLFPEWSQTLLNATIVQTETHTILTFSKHLLEPDEIPIDGNGRTTFLWAHGFGNKLSVHSDRGAFDLTLHPCHANHTKHSPNTGTGVEIQTKTLKTYRSLWVAHGVLGGVAWGVFVPLAISSSILRDLIPRKRLWFKIHMFLNVMASLFTIVAFTLAVVGREKETVSGESSHHFAKVAHRTVGLVILLSVTFQVVVLGFLRPHPPSRHQKGSDEEARGQYTTLHNNGATKESVLRKVWEIAHKLFGFALLGTAFWQVQDGLSLFGVRFGLSFYLRHAFWLWVAALAIVTAAFYVYSRFFYKRRRTVPLPQT